MKKLIYFLALNLILSSSVMAAKDSTVLLSGGGDVTKTSSVSLSLTGLVPSATYSIICYINAPYPFEIVRFSAQYSDSTSTISSYSLNGTNVTQGALNVGANTAVIVGSFTNPSTSTIVFTNLDQTNTFSVHDCFATAVVG
jgi:hypothetical protein